MNNGIWLSVTRRGGPVVGCVAVGVPADRTRLKSRRKELGYSQHELAELIGMEARYCGIAERGERTPALKVLLTWCRALGLSVRLEDKLADEPLLAELTALRREVRDLCGDDRGCETAAGYGCGAE